ncbi:FecCD family ABC transporter permease [Clostridium ganghwense]|uniref:Iron ABC transporter permease n=1 Tax=Clostridium ganghwense TaxID=312089 RepID=A0ABT4CP50_9CLOT|nr:iron ABC transporter permease [Clostridium ganghwense]MCY6370728.1 iron ABC transporter permease [Clostridium ganghwense]
MRNSNKKFYSVIVIFILLLTILTITALVCGKVNLFTLKNEVIRDTILIKIRLPRVILAISAGCILAVSGAVLQSLLNNPLADSYTLGISSGAALGACLTIYINIVFEKNIPIQFNAIVFSLLVLILVIKIAGLKGRLTITNLVLAGIIVSSICQAGVSFFKSIADEDAVSMINWLMGNLGSKTIFQVLMVTVTALVGTIICFKYSKELNIMTMGRREALLVGVNYDFINKLFLIICALMTAMCVSLCGIIGFVGLVVPHLTRLLIGADNQRVIPVSAILGSLLLLGADTLTRVVLNHELPVGVLTTLVGGPFFCYIFIKRKEVI